MHCVARKVGACLKFSDKPMIHAPQSNANQRRFFKLLGLIQFYIFVFTVQNKIQYEVTSNK